MIGVRAETPQQEDVAALLRLADAVAATLYPGEARRAIDPAALDRPGVVLLVARVAGRAAGCCAVFDRGDGSAEIKRMIVAAEHRRKGVGKALLRGADTLAMRRGIALLLLEVGIRNAAAHAMYVGAGFTPRACFPPYVESPISRFLEKPVSSPRPRSAR